MQTYVIVAVIAYLLGSIPFGYILVRLFRKQDVRTIGSGNIGATNVARSGAKGLGILTLILDAAKGYTAVTLALNLHPAYLSGNPLLLPDGNRYDMRQMYVRAAIAAIFAIPLPV